MAEDGEELRQKKPLAGVMPWLGVVLLIAAGGLTVWRAVVARANHVDFDIRQAWLPCGLGLLWGVMGLRRSPDRRLVAILLIVVSVLVAGLVLVLDQWNVLVENELWRRRGMPGPWQF